MRIFFEDQPENRKREFLKSLHMHTETNNLAKKLNSTITNYYY